MGIEEEIEEGIKPLVERHGNSGKIYFFNNLDGNLPGGFRTGYPLRVLKSQYRCVSKRKRGQTVVEFQEECRTAVIEAGLTPEQIIEARRRFNEEQANGSYGEGTDNFFELLKKVYIILRKRGYKHYPDLIS